jgi:hypothetical protein
MIENVLKEKYADLVSMTKLRQPNYPVIDFEGLLAEYGKDTRRFLAVETVIAIRQQLKESQLEDRTLFAKRGRLIEVPIGTLRYYQKEVGITGPKHTHPDEPVSIIEWNNEMILWDGYHRTLVKMVLGRDTINGYVLTL